MVAPSGGFGACGTSRGNGVLYITFRRTRTASLGLKRWVPPAPPGSAATAALSCRSTAKSSSTQMPRPYVPTIKSLLWTTMSLYKVVGRLSISDCQWSPSSNETYTALSVPANRSEEHTSELQSQSNLVCRLLLEKKKKEK